MPRHTHPARARIRTRGARRRARAAWSRLNNLRAEKAPPRPTHRSDGPRAGNRGTPRAYRANTSTTSTGPRASSPDAPTTATTAPRSPRPLPPAHLTRPIRDEWGRGTTPTDTPSGVDGGCADVRDGGARGVFLTSERPES